MPKVAYRRGNEDESIDFLLHVSSLRQINVSCVYLNDVNWTVLHDSHWKFCVTAVHKFKNFRIFFFKHEKSLADKDKYNNP